MARKKVDFACQRVDRFRDLLSVQIYSGQLLHLKDIHHHHVRYQMLNTWNTSETQQGA